MFSPYLQKTQFALKPKMFGSDGPFNPKSISELIPSMKVPSDHYPVAVDLRINGNQEKTSIPTAGDANPSSDISNT